MQMSQLPHSAMNRDCGMILYVDILQRHKIVFAQVLLLTHRLIFLLRIKATLSIVWERQYLRHLTRRYLLHKVTPLEIKPQLSEFASQVLPEEHLCNTNKDLNVYDRASLKI